MASYVAAYRIGMLVSTAGALFLVSGFQSYGLGHHAAWTRRLRGDGGARSDRHRRRRCCATEPEKSVAAERPSTRARQSLQRASSMRRSAPFREFLSRDLAFVALAFVVLFKFTDALSGAMTAPFVIDLGFSRNEYAAIIKGVGLAATLIGGFAGGFMARAYPLPTSLWIGGVLQALANLRVLLAGRRRASTPRGSLSLIVAENLHQRHRHGDLRRLSLGAVPQSAAHGDAICAADRAGGVRAHLSFARAPAISPAPPAGRGFSSSARWPACRRSCCWPGCSTAGISTG